MAPFTRQAIQVTAGFVIGVVLTSLVWIMMKPVVIYVRMRWFGYANHDEDVELGVTVQS
jgi:hypothetical protein